ncbi:MAG: heparinase II/III family protein [Clostridia bacterium]|nr:heparinase II/III family protein [Clostridia bacterium]
MNLLGRAASPEFWQEVREDEAYRPYREELLQLWEKNCAEPIYALKYSEFKLYGVTGDRSVFQAPYYLRRRALNTSALLSMIYPEEEKYITRLMDQIFAICDEYTWVIPAHQPDLLTMAKSDHLDLFACETAYALSEIYTLLGDRLEPLIRDRIRVEVDRRLITPIMEGKKFGWMKARHNWNAVCSGSMGCAFMLMRPDLFPQIKPMLDESMEYYPSGLGDDGICAEGFHYWHYGFGFFTTYADMVRTFTEGETDYFKREKVKQVAMFIQRMYLNGKATVTFSDGGQTEWHLGILHYLKNEYPDDVVLPPLEYSYNQDACGRWCWHLRAALWLKKEFLTPEAPKPASTYYAQDMKWLVHKAPKYGFAIKSGHNAEPHNHNDVGAFILAVNGRQIVTDPGPGPYSKQYFAAETRYQTVQCSSRSHSVPIIGGVYQKEGAQYVSENTVFENGVFSADIAKAYPVEGLSSFVREVSFTEDTVNLRDSFVYTGEGDVIDRISVNPKPTVGEAGEILLGEVTLKYDPAKYTVAINSEAVNDKRTLYYIDFKPNAGVTEFNLCFKIN